ncbi:hypothetical protein [Novipirellula sp.]|uniref:hypothetical protein n=1 Tax=Novipirellula sp. TaxID=2795430 RepID=UPI00356B003C
MSSRHRPWFITLTCDGELSNSAEPSDHRPSVLLLDAELQQLDTALSAIDIDYMPDATADGAARRTLTYRVGSRDLLLRGFQSGATSGDYKSTALISDVHVSLDGTTKTDAISVTVVNATSRDTTKR